MQQFSSYLSTFILIYVLFTALFYFLSDFAIFFPPNPSSFRPDANTHVIKLADGTRVHGSYFPNENSKYTILFSHGNAEDLGTLQPLLKFFQEQGYAIFAYDYRGYGLNKGRPNEKNTYEDIQGAYDHLTQKLKVDPKTIIVYGRSLGGGPSLELAQDNEIGALILESSFVSTYRVQTKYPVFFFDKYINIRKISDVKVPVFIIHGEKDTIIPLWHGEALFEEANDPKELYIVKGADHNNLLYVAQEEYWIRLRKFVEGLAAYE